jgi:hypothetical protein
MASRTETITFDNFSFVAHKFNLGEAEELADVAADMSNSAAPVRVRMVGARTALLIAIRRDKPDATEEFVKSMSGYRMGEAPAALATPPAA